MNLEREAEIRRDLAALMEDLQPEELPQWLKDRGRALQCYARSRQTQDAQQRLMSLYNGYGLLVGFTNAVQYAEEDLGGTDGRLFHALKYARQEGDSDTAGCGRWLTDQDLERLAGCLRRRLLEK